MKLSGIDCLITPQFFVNVADKGLSLAVRPPFSAVTGSLYGPISQGHRAGPFSRCGAEPESISGANECLLASILLVAGGMWRIARRRGPLS